ncbi:FUSC family protein [Robbsia sp. Bb-Pol-6]|uniref:FUSC family protein n=1 Tax=Robbsia betulipollinis TaxID=2981849 RepID=A0ABT3ZS64_9BURK|nr:FUSC family protein [Robbsia betulipollinis]MCY0389381.1 FUSC family protein [Robbsia betulipollinis]
MIIVAFSRVADRLRLVDPGLVRLRTAFRSALGCASTGALGIGWTVLHRQPPTLAALGMLFAMIAPLFIREPRRAGWYASLLSLYLCSSASFALASLLAPHARLADLGFVAILFVGILCQACGPRALGCAMTGFVTFYLGLYLHPAPAQALTMLALSVSGPVVVSLVGRLILPAHPARMRRLALRTVTLRARRVLALHRTAPDAALDVPLSALNEAALAVEEHLSLLGEADALPIRERLVELEVAAGQLASASASATAAVEAGVERLARAIARLDAGERLWDAPALAPVTRHAPARLRWADLQARLAWRHALRAASAAVIAMAIGHALSPERWFWAVITTFVVFLGTRSRADTLYRGMERLAGTLAGALTSVLLATALHATPVLMVLVMVLCVFGWAYTILHAYSRGVFFITVLVGLVYAELGFAIRPLVTARIEEVLTGCLVSFAVAFVLMPLTATRHIETRLLAVLRALRMSLQASTGAPQATPDTPGTAMRRLDRSWHDLRVAWRPFQTQRVFAWNPGHELALGSLFACLHAARELSRLATAGTAGTAGATDANARDRQREHLDAIMHRLDVLIEVHAADNGTAGSSPEGGADAVGRNRLATVSASSETPIDALPADTSPALAQLDGATRQLAERLARISATSSGKWPVRWPGFMPKRVWRPADRSPPRGSSA